MLPVDLDVDLGSPGDPREPVKETFERRGMAVSNTPVTRLRSGATSPARTAYRLACVDKLRSNDAALKNEYCLHALAAGREHRRPTRSSRGIYACLGLSGAMRAALGCTPPQLSCILRTIRADLALWSTSTWDEQLGTEFHEAASLFLRVHHDRNWRAIRGVTDLIRVAWDQQTIHGFYFALYHVAGSLTRAAWLPYELDVLRSFYVRQHELGDPLTPLDRQVLAGGVNLSPTDSELAGVVQAHVGVGYDVSCVTMHRRLLVTGSPKAVRGLRSGAEG